MLWPFVIAVLIAAAFFAPFLLIQRVKEARVAVFARTLVLILACGGGAWFVWRLVQHNTPSNLDPSTVGFILGFAALMQRPPFIYVALGAAAFIAGTILGARRRLRRRDETSSS